MMHAIIVAGGSGTRMNSSLPKQFLTIHSKSILQYSVEAFINAFDDIHIIVCLPESYLQLGKQVLGELMEKYPITLIRGGETRFHSVLNGLNALHIDEGIVFVHDAVRPCINSSFLHHLASECLEYGHAIPSIAVKDSLRKVSDQDSKSVDRNEYRIIQTPQVFKVSDLKHAFTAPYQAIFTDEASVLESYGKKIHLCNGLERNIKITTPDDLPLAEVFLRSN